MFFTRPPKKWAKNLDLKEFSNLKQKISGFLGDKRQKIQYYLGPIQKTG
jgi:hypothetical protein